VDVAKLKAEFTQQYYDAKGTPLRARMIAHFAGATALASLAPWAWNLVFGTPWLRRLANRAVGFHPERSIPAMPEQSLRHWFEARAPRTDAGKGRVFFFCDEFTDVNDVAAGRAAIELLEGLGYAVVLPEHGESGRAALSKGLLRRARALAAENVRLLEPWVGPEAPLVGIEPSAILSFRDEYPELLRGADQAAARRLAPHCLMLEEFLAREMDAGRIEAGRFTPQRRVVHLHGHCHQKALASVTPTVRVLEQLGGYDIRAIPSGCCGMAGSFGYEAEHYGVSQKIGELVLFPRVRQAGPDEVIAAPGTSCRHQIHDGTGRTAWHPAELLRQALA
jgi:Fe-S oxidoreductase